MYCIMADTHCQTDVDARDLMWYNAHRKRIVGQDGLCRNHHCCTTCAAITTVAVQEWRYCGTGGAGVAHLALQNRWSFGQG